MSISIDDLTELFKNKDKYYVGEHRGHTGIPENSDDGVHSEYNETFKLYKHPALPENIVMMETYHTDSYGYDPYLVSVCFAEAIKKTIITYEPI